MRPQALAGALGTLAAKAMREHAGTACSPAPIRVGAVDHHHRGCLNAPTAFRRSTKTTGFDLPAVHQVDECPGSVDVIAHEDATRPHMVQRCTVVAILPIICTHGVVERDRGIRSRRTAFGADGSASPRDDDRDRRRSTSSEIRSAGLGDTSRRAARWMRSRRRPRRRGDGQDPQHSRELSVQARSHHVARRDLAPAILRPVCSRIGWPVRPVQ